MSSSPRTALLEYAEPLQTALHCVTPVRLRYTAEEIGIRETLRFANASGVELKRRDRVSNVHYPSVYLWVDQHISTWLASVENEPRRYQVSTLGYDYSVLDRHGREVPTFHWHPGQRSHEQDPHLHVGSGVVNSGAGDFGKTFSSLHIPTERVALARIVRMLITEFQVVPNRQDWERVLERLLLGGTDR